MSLFKKTEKSEPNIAENIVGFFNKASPIHYSIIVLGLCFAILVLVLIVCLCYLRIPKILSYILCCFNKNCSLRRKALAREQDKQNLKVYYQNSENDQVRIMLKPSCTPEEIGQAQNNGPLANPLLGPPIIPSQDLSFRGAGICVNGIPTCYCARNGRANLLPCQGRTQ